MNEKIFPFSKEEILEIIKKYPTPFHIYDEKAIRENAREFLKAFTKLEGFKEFFAVKANPNPYILKILIQEGFGLDCSSFSELVIAEKLGIKGEQIMFTSNDTPAEEYRKAKQLNAIINLDDISHVEFLEKNAGLPDLICLRYNPGSLRKGNEIIGKPDATLYVWQKTPKNIDGINFTKKLLQKEIAIVATPGVLISTTINDFNPGDNYVRFALVPTLDEIKEAVRRIMVYLK